MGGDYAEITCSIIYTKDDLDVYSKEMIEYEYDSDIQLPEILFELPLYKDEIYTGRDFYTHYYSISFVKLKDNNIKLLSSFEQIESNYDEDCLYMMFILKTY